MDRKFWDHAYDEEPSNQSVPDRIIGPAVASLEPGKALDLGCGTGEIALSLADKGWHVLGIDWAPNAVRIAREHADSQRLDASFFVADVTEWEPPDRYDLVISTFAMPKADKVESAMRTAAKALAPGGMLMIAEWDRSMASEWQVEPAALPTLDSVTAHLADLEIVVAEVRRLKNVSDFIDEADAIVICAKNR